MPELPEVHTILRQIEPEILHKKVTDFSVTGKGLKLIAPLDQQLFTERIVKRKILELRRHGKFMVFELDDGQKIIGHLRMSGRLSVSRWPLTHKHNRLQLKFADGTYLNFIDTRRFATFHLLKTNQKYPGLDKLGPDALSPNLTAKILHQKLKTRKKNIYSALLDQSVIAGLGNIYVNESLFASKSYPKRSAGSLTLNETKLLLKNIRKILSTAINLKGTTLLDKTYLDGGGKEGKFYNLLRVYDREAKPCFVCTTKIKRIRIGNRSVYFCPKCQT